MSEIIGFEQVNYTQKSSGEFVMAYRIFLTSDLPSGTGKRCEEVFMRVDRLGGYVPVLGDMVFVQRDARGFVQSLVKV